VTNVVSHSDAQGVPPVSDALNASLNLVRATWRAWLVPALGLGVAQALGLRFAPTDAEWWVFARAVLAGDPHGLPLGLHLIGTLLKVSVFVGLLSTPLYLLIIDRLAHPQRPLADRRREVARALRRTPTALAAGVLFLSAGLIGGVLLLVPGLWITGRWLLWPALVVTESLGPVAALERSARLIDGSWWWTNIVVSILLIGPPLLLAVPLAGLEALLPPAFVGLASVVGTVALAAVVPAGLVVCVRTLESRQAGS
jgi:hypothetical protein